MPYVRRPRVLVVEAEETARYAFAHALTMAGYHPVQASGGMTALITARRDHPHVIVLDLELAVTDGYELLRAVRRIDATRHAPAIAMTNCENDADRARVAGFATCLHKPVSSEILVNTVHLTLFGTERAPLTAAQRR